MQIKLCNWFKRFATTETSSHQCYMTLNQKLFAAKACNPSIFCHLHYTLEQRTLENVPSLPVQRCVVTRMRGKREEWLRVGVCRVSLSCWVWIMRSSRRVRKCKISPIHDRRFFPIRSHRRRKKHEKFCRKKLTNEWKCLLLRDLLECEYDRLQRLADESRDKKLRMILGDSPFPPSRDLIIHSQFPYCQ